MNIEDIFSGMASAKLNGKGNYLPPGFNGRVVFNPLKYNPKGHHGKSIVFEYRLKTSNLDAAPVGSTFTQVIMLKDDNGYAMGDLKQIMFSIAGVDPNKVRAFEVDPAPHNEATDMLKAAISEPSVIENEEVLLETIPYTVKKDGPNKGKTIALHRWSPTPEAVAARAKAAEEPAVQAVA